MQKSAKKARFGRIGGVVWIRYSVLLALVLLAGAGCRKTSVPLSEPSARSDQQVSGDIQAKISAETALNGQNVQVGVQGGVATLSGTVSDAASRSLAGNDAGTVDGVKTVVNDLVIAPPLSASASMLPSSRQPSPQPDTRSMSERRRRDNGARVDGYRNQNAQAQPPAAIQNQPTPSDTNQNTQGNSQAQTNQVPQRQPNPAPAFQPPPRPVDVNVTVAEGTVIPVRITEALDSAQTQADETFHGTLADDLVVNGMVAMSRGASVMGRVINVRDAAHFKGSSLLSIELTQVMAHGREVPVVTDAYTKEGQGRGKNTAEKAGGGAAIGAIIGAIAGGGKGAAIGAAAGGGIGAGSNGVSRGQQVQIAAETVVNFRLQSPITVTTSRRVGSPHNDQQDTPHPILEQRN